MSLLRASEFDYMLYLLPAVLDPVTAKQTKINTGGLLLRSLVQPRRLVELAKYRWSVVLRLLGLPQERQSLVPADTAATSRIVSSTLNGW